MDTTMTLSPIRTADVNTYCQNQEERTWAQLDALLQEHCPFSQENKWGELANPQITLAQAGQELASRYPSAFKGWSCSFEKLNVGNVVPFAGIDPQSWADTINLGAACPRFGHKTAPKTYHQNWTSEQQARMIILLWGGCWVDVQQYAETLEIQTGKKTVKI